MKISPFFVIKKREREELCLMNTCLDEWLKKVVLKNLHPGRFPGTLSYIYQGLKVFEGTSCSRAGLNLDLVFIHGNVLWLTLVRVTF